MKNNIIICGDSIVYGIGDFETNGWATMFKNYIVNKDDSKVCNNYVHIAGFPGATSTDILNKIESILKSFKHEEFKNIVILSIGINDTKEFNGNQKNSIEKFKENICKITKIVLENNCDLIILGLTRIECGEKFLWKPNKYDNEVISEYDKDLQSILNFDSELEVLCKKNKIKYIPMKDVLQKEDFIDGLHPNTNGHKKICEYLINKL
ncbi:MAG: SGNH/GDSL hydrolase family protein [Clostridia bacterium]|nr:SGNH/GDSL hydrolase family protein [Clostridia bacterium]